MRETTLSLENQFYSPFSVVLVKAESSNGKWNIFLQASNEGLDQEKETIFCKALKDAKDYYLSHGILSWDHKHKLLHDPAYIIGEPTEVAFTDDNKTLVKGFLYQKNKIAKSLFENIESGATKLGASVGGGILKKSENNILKVVWDETAITHKPVNDGTLGTVSLMPFPEFVKALMAGSGVDAAAFSGGRALTLESIQGDKVDHLQEAVSYAEARNLFDELNIGIYKGEIITFDDVSDRIESKGYPTSVASGMIKFLKQKLPGYLVG